MVQGSLEQACRLQSMAVPSLEMLVQVNKQQETSAFLLLLHLLMQIQTDLLHLVCFKTGIFMRRKEIRLNCQHCADCFSHNKNCLFEVFLMNNFTHNLFYALYLVHKHFKATNLINLVMW